ncbi:MAG: hypothetical protein UW03_C0028G0010 [Candidatus Peregrinibacteria bacterium GW2011_GWA2_43_8]|nr:MAG: hypothetical protein UW03_C0028G0010 [Candidatus Peregrinibacteria bacterium GW2011_GWA2_43_8]
MCFAGGVSFGMVMVTLKSSAHRPSFIMSVGEIETSGLGPVLQSSLPSICVNGKSSVNPTSGP